MSEKVPLLRALSTRCNFPNENLAEYLFIDRRTLYNYKNYPTIKLPQKVKTKLIQLFSQLVRSINSNTSILEVENYINSISEVEGILLQRKFLKHVERIRPETSTSMERYKSLESILSQFDTSISYIENILELSYKKTAGKEDYLFLDYIQNYKT